MSADMEKSKAQDQEVQRKRLAVVIVHTWAPGANALNYQEACSRSLGPDVEVREVRVTGFDAVRRAAEEAVQAGAWLIISVGGDGTANAVVNGLGDSPTRLIVLPGGTANDLGYSLGQSNDPAAVASMIGQFEPIEIDAMQVNGHRFVLVSSLGWASEWSSVLNRLRANEGFIKKLVLLFGKNVFLFALLWVMAQHRKIGGKMVLRYRDLQDNIMKTRELDALGIAVLSYPNAARGDYPMFHFSDIADGKFEIMIWSRMSTVRMVKFVAGLRTGEHLKMPETSCIQTDYCEIECSRPLECYADGELRPLSSSYRFQIDPVPIRMMAPKCIRPGSRKLSEKYS